MHEHAVLHVDCNSIHWCNDACLQALFMESPLGVNMKVMELMETKLSPWAINRLARCSVCYINNMSSLTLFPLRSLSNSQLTVLTLDYQK